MLSDSIRDRTICIIGLGYVGLTLAVAMAEAGFRIIGVEVDPKILAALSQGRAHFSEYGLNDRLAAQVASGRFSASADLAHAAEATAFVVTVGTPVGQDKRTKFTALETVVRGISRVMKPDDLVVLRSTVRVGTTRDIVAPILDATAKPYDLAFCPERTLEGKALAELATLPQIVGGTTPAATFRASQMFSMLTPTIVRVRDAETAELVKLINNTQRDLMFAFANEVAAACDAIGVSAHEVIASGNIGYPRAGLPLPGPVGGPCLEKDPYIFAEGLEPFGFAPNIALAGRKWNEGLPERSAADIAGAYEAAGGAAPERIAVLGVAFKGRPETGDTRGTMAIPLAAALSSRFPGAVLTAWDAEVDDSELAALGFAPAASAQAAAEGASIVVMQNNHRALEELKLAELAGAMRTPGLIYDFWNQHARLEHSEVAPGIRYVALGALNVRR